MVVLLDQTAAEQRGKIKLPIWTGAWLGTLGLATPARGVLTFDPLSIRSPGAPDSHWAKEIANALTGGSTVTAGHR